MWLKDDKVVLRQSVLGALSFGAVVLRLGVPKASARLQALCALGPTLRADMQGFSK